jgi:hypothetical protein
MADYYNKLEAATVREAARQYLKSDSFVKVTLFPEKVAAPEPVAMSALASVR